GALAQVLHHQQGREQVADPLGELGVPLDILAECGPLAATLAVEEVLGQPLDGVALAAGDAHGSAPITRGRRGNVAGPGGPYGPGGHRPRDRTSAGPLPTYPATAGRCPQARVISSRNSAPAPFHRRATAIPAFRRRPG